MNITGHHRSILGELREPVIEELKVFQKHFKDAVRSNVGLVDLVTRYILHQKGKQVRPLLVLLSAKACGGVTESSYRGATLVEILHTATLVHDDVVDDADTRRGLASINAVWKNKVAVLMGDYLLSRGLLLSLQHSDYLFLRSTSAAVKRMSEGELLQIQKTRHLDLEEQTYLKIIADKTASLISTCTEIGAASSSADTDRIESMKSFGEHLGMAFQIRDDILDYLGRRSVIGKPIGIDMKEKKLTLPAIYALNHSSKKDARRALSYIRNGRTGRELRWLVDFVRSEGGIDYAHGRAIEFADLAHAELQTLRDSSAKDALHRFVDFVVERDR